MPTVVGNDVLPETCCTRKVRDFVKSVFRGRCKKRHTAEQIALALRQSESGTSVTEIMLKLGVSEQVFYRWQKFDG
jgi:hypothetical protein